MRERSGCGFLGPHQGRRFGSTVGWFERVVIVVLNLFGVLVMSLLET